MHLIIICSYFFMQNWPCFMLLVPRYIKVTRMRYNLIVSKIVVTAIHSISTTHLVSLVDLIAYFSLYVFRRSLLYGSFFLDQTLFVATGEFELVFFSKAAFTFKF